VTISFGGSVFAPKKLRVEAFQKMAEAVHKMAAEKHDVLIVTGGGEPARELMAEGRKLRISSAGLDKIGIDVTRLNARFLISALGPIAEPDPPTTLEAAVRASMKNKVPVMGGTTPGQTTDAVAAALARLSDSKLLIIISDVGAVYTSDPKTNPKAKKIERMTPEQLVELVGGTKLEPGMKTIVDPVAARLIERYRIKTLVVGEAEINRLPDILAGAKHSGTTIG